MPSLPSSLALTNIADGASIVAADHRNNYAAIQTATNALIALLSNGLLDGDPMVWDIVNAKWVAASTLGAGRPRAPRVVTSAMSGGPPASPVDGDIWIATGVDANGTRWPFQYNAGSASSFKWEFIGGPAVYLAGATIAIVNTKTQVGALGYYYDAATMSFTAPRAGDYDIDGDAQLIANGGGAGNWNLAAFAGAVNQTTVGGGLPAGQNPSEAILGKAFAVAASTVIGIAVLPVTPGTNQLGATHLKIKPTRIS